MSDRCRAGRPGLPGGSLSTRDRLSRLYRRAIGYCPFEDDPTATNRDVLAILKQWRKQARIDENYLELGRGNR
jgi:hypothetical protein